LNYKNFKKRNPNPKLNKGKIGFFGGSRRESWEVGIEKFSKYNKLLYLINYLGLGPNPIPNIFKPYDLVFCFGFCDGVVCFKGN
jgi:hypothetical protein